jgi:hypothetical protein
MGPDPAEAEAWLTRAAAKGDREAERLIPLAQRGKRQAQNEYHVRDEWRKYWESWNGGATYYLVWTSTGWHAR